VCYAGYIQYQIGLLLGTSNDFVCIVELFDKSGHQLIKQIGLKSTVKISNATFWWPAGFNESVAYLYLMKVAFWSKYNQ